MCTSTILFSHIDPYLVISVCKHEYENVPRSMFEFVCAKICRAHISVLQINSLYICVQIYESTCLCMNIPACKFLYAHVHSDLPLSMSECLCVQIDPYLNIALSICKLFYIKVH